MMVMYYGKHKNKYRGYFVTIPEADTSVYEPTVIERSKFSFDQLAYKVAIIDNGERVVRQHELQSMGFVCDPFWNTSNNREGDCYNDYLVSHPDFSLELRKGVVDRLVIAQKLLPPHWKIVLKSGFRPIEVQTHLLRSFIDESKEKTQSGAMPNFCQTPGFSSPTL